MARELNSRSGFSAHIRLGDPDRYPWLGGDLRRFPGYRACVRRIGGAEIAFRPRVYINQIRYRLDPGEWPFYDKHLADKFGMADSSKPFPENPDGVDILVEPDYTHFVEFYLDRPPVLRVLEADMQKGPAIEGFEVRNSMVRAGIYINSLPMPYEWDKYPVFCVAEGRASGAEQMHNVWASYANPPQFAYPPGTDPGIEFVDPESADAAGVPQSHQGWFEPATPCACPECAARGES